MLGKAVFFCIFDIGGLYNAYKQFNYIIIKSVIKCIKYDRL